MKTNYEAARFQQLYKDLKAPVLSYVRRSVRDGQVAEELTQEVFLKAYRARDTFESERVLSTWLWAIARNTVCDWHRKESGEPWRARAPGDAREELCETLPSREPDAESLFSRHADRRELRSTLRQLTRLQRRVLWYRVVRELSYEEISRRLGLSVSAAKCAFYRARLALTAKLAYA